MPTVEGALDGIPAAFTIDTGNNGTLQLYEYWAQQHGLAERYRHGVETVSYGAGGASRNWVSYGRSFSMGGVTIPRPMIRTTDDKGGVALSISETGNLGTALLGNYTLTFDYARSRVCADYVPGYVPVPFSRAGMRAIKVDPEGFSVSLVNPGSPAAQAGLQKEDRITAVDGQPARLLGGGDLTRTLTRAPGTRVSIDYIRDGKNHHTELVLRELLR
jgi:membrane-associated protease RseP (regulator of RpoE activity)